MGTQMELRLLLHTVVSSQVLQGSHGRQVATHPLSVQPGPRRTSVTWDQQQEAHVSMEGHHSDLSIPVCLTPIPKGQMLPTEVLLIV